MNFVLEIEKLLEYLAQLVPLELFTLVGAFIEELIAPIPSPFVMTLSGSLAHTQNKAVINIFVLAVIGSIGKTIGAYILYLIADKLEDYIVPKFGKYLGVTHKGIENIGLKLHSSWRDDIFIFVSRALPVMPSAPISIVCGILKLDLITYLMTTFLGNIIRNFIFLYFGFLGTGNFKSVFAGFDSIESIIKLIIFVVFLTLILFSYYKRARYNMADANSIID